MSGWGVPVLWGLFTVTFVVMGVREALAAKRGLHVDKHDHGFADMNRAQEILRTAIIEADRSSHRIAAVSYLLAAAVALASFALAILD